MIEAAVSQCMLTLKAHCDVTPEGIQKLVGAFEAIGVSKARIEKFCQCRAEAIKPAQIIRLRNVYASIKDGMSGPDDWFEPEEKPAVEQITSEKKSLKDKLKERKAKAEPDPLPVEEHAEPETPQPEPEPTRADLPDEAWVKAYAQGTDAP